METASSTGYFIEPAVLSGVECERILDALAPSLVSGGRAGTRHMMGDPTVRTVADDPRLLGLARSVLGDNAAPYRATLFSKSAEANWLVAWHQDTALPLEARFDAPDWGPWSRKEGVAYAHAPTWALSRIVAIRVHLDPSTSENGPLRVIPGSHTAGVLSDDDVAAVARAGQPVECLAGRGGVIGMRPLIIHASSKARNDRARRVLHIEYADSLDLAPGIRLAVA